MEEVECVECVEEEVVEEVNCVCVFEKQEVLTVKRQQLYNCLFLSFFSVCFSVLAFAILISNPDLRASG